jgi:amino acid permease
MLSSALNSPLVKDDSASGFSDLAEPPSSDSLKEGHTRVSFFGTLMTLLNALLGAGILGIPSTFQDSGLLLCMLLMIIVTFLSYVATAMTLKLQQATSSDGMDDIALHLMGPHGMFWLSIMILIFNVCALLAYLIICTDFIISWLRLANIDWSGRWPRAAVVAVYGLALPIALSVPKNLKFLSYISTFTFFLILFYTVAIVYEMAASVADRGLDPSRTLFQIDLRIFSSIAVHTLAFALPTCVCPIICDSDPNVNVRIKACFWSLLIALVICLVPSIACFLEFGENIQGNMLNTYADDNKLMIVVRAVFFLFLTLTYPAAHPPVICSWSVLIFKLNNAIDLMGWRRVVALVVTNGIPLIIAMFLPDMKPAIEIGGAIGGCLGNFTFPAVMWILHSKKPMRHWTNVLTAIFAVWGCATAVLSTYCAVVDAIAAFTKE